MTAGRFLRREEKGEQGGVRGEGSKGRGGVKGEGKGGQIEGRGKRSLVEVNAL